jgi:MFS family permease
VAPKQNYKLLFGLVIFTSAFLLFQVQPLISKYILPWYGGTPTVWTTALLFFQVLLVGGYAYAHLSNRYLRRRAQAVLHVALLVGAALLLPITPADRWKPSAALENPTSHILVLLAVSVGLAYFALASTSPLMQAWISRTAPDKSPYRFYALSNAGSLLALLSYPFVIEPGFALQTQFTMWSAGFIVFGLASVGAAVWLWRGRSVQAPTRSAEGPRGESTNPGDQPRVPLAPRPGDWLLWMALPATASVLLLATTNQLTQQVAVVPFLWVLPLSLYLLSFIVCFENQRLYARIVFVPVFLAAIPALLYILPRDGEPFPPVSVHIALYSILLFASCMACHGELARLKPHPRHLTAFYLMISIGGALGGVFVALVAPLIFPRFFELHVGVVLCFALLLTTLFVDRASPIYHGRRKWVWSMLLVAFAAIGYGLYAEATNALAEQRDSTRNFYGISWVEENRSGDPAWHHDAFLHSGIRHGSQYVAAERRCQPTTYFVEASGVGMAIRQFPRQDLRIGVVGLGVGVLATYTKPGDYMRFYEINPAVARVARQDFSFLSECATNVDVVLGDGRLMLEQEAAQEFDILVLDAFRGDAPPVHLMTVEAFETYLRHLKPDGVIAVQISSNHFNFKPVVWKMAAHFGFESLVLILGSRAGEVDSSFYDMHATWMLLTKNSELLAALPRPPPDQLGPSDHAQVLVDWESFRAFPVPEEEEERELFERVRLWTDDYTNPFQVLK